jgi:hypothetical protein
MASGQPNASPNSATYTITEIFRNVAQQEVVRQLQACLEASVYVAPSDFGLTYDELMEVGKSLGLKEGEINDALPQVGPIVRPTRRLVLPKHLWETLGHLAFLEDPDRRNVDAFDFVVTQLNELARQVGAAKASLDYNILLDRAQAHAQIKRRDIELAITLLVQSGQILSEDGTLKLPGGVRHLPSAERTNLGSAHPRIPKPDRERALPHVKDVIERRSDGRAKSSEPLTAFADQMEKLGYGHFRLWWSQTVAELRFTQPSSSPLSALVLSAALVEAALTFVVKHAQSLSLGVFASPDFAKDPRTWKIEDLVKSAARGGDSAILDAQTTNRADGLIIARQRIHAGRMMSTYPGGLPDLKPEEARESIGVAEQVVRKVLDWLEKYPPA